MNLERVRTLCLSLPHTTEQVQWGDNLVFKIGGKIYAIEATVPAGRVLSFKCTLEEFVELTERPGIFQAPYFAKMQWVALESFDALTDSEIRRLVTKSYELVVAKLPKKARAGW